MAKTIKDPKEAAATLKAAVQEAGSVVFFGGAGVSTASGIPDFRSPNGLYHQRGYKYPPETMLSHSFYQTHREEFFDFYRHVMCVPDAKPNQCHRKLAQLEQEGKLTAVVTQNIDGLHQAAGSRRVYELHGSTHRNICRKCGAVYDQDWVLATTGEPRCEKCGGPVKPDVVLYEESLDQRHPELRPPDHWRDLAGGVSRGGAGGLLPWQPAGHLQPGAHPGRRHGGRHLRVRHRQGLRLVAAPARAVAPRTVVPQSRYNG